MVGSAVFTAEASDQTRHRRLANLPGDERAELQELRDRRDDPEAARRYLALLQRADSVAPIDPEPDHPDQPDINRLVWNDAVRIRDTGRLLAEGRAIRCPVLVVHGAQDPHPVEGVVEPLREVVADLDVVVLERCGHTPWNERHARERFLQAVLDACG